MNFFNINTPPSLTTLASNRIALSLWNSKPAFVEVQRSTEPCDAIYHTECNFVADLTRFLSLPETLKALIRFSVLRMGSYLSYWMKSFSSERGFECYHSVNCFYPRICWTHHGTIDVVKTARRLATNSRLDINFRYRLSCFYSQKDLIDNLWNEMSDHCRLKEHELEECFSVFWTSYKHGNLLATMNSLNEPISVFMFGFNLSKNEASKEFFWNKLTVAEKNQLLDKVAAWDYDVREAFFIRKMAKELLEDLLARHGLFSVLSHLSYDGHYDAFYESVECYRDYLTQEDFGAILDFLSKSAPWLVGKIWLLATGEMRRSFWDFKGIFRVTAPHKSELNVLRRLFLVGERDALERILMYATKEHLISLFDPDMTEVLWIPRQLILCGNWRMLKYFGEELIKTKDIMNRVRVALTPLYLTYNRQNFNLKNLQNWLVIVEPQFFAHVSTLLDIRPEKGCVVKESSHHLF